MYNTIDLCHCYLIYYSADYIGCGKRTTYPREGEVVYGVETDPTEAAWPRSCRATANLPANTKRENKTNEGTYVHTCMYTSVSRTHYTCMKG